MRYYDFQIGSDSHTIYGASQVRIDLNNKLFDRYISFILLVGLLNTT